MTEACRVLSATMVQGLMVIAVDGGSVPVWIGGPATSDHVQLCTRIGGRFGSRFGAVGEGNGAGMVSRVMAVAVDCQDAEGLAAFWCAALGAEMDQRWRDAHGVEYVQISTEEGPVLVFQPVPECKSGKNRLHLDIAPATGSQEAEVERLVGVGATRLSDEPELPWVVLADPEGNEFCVLPPGG
jgi:predicted enzyme related to lactoylglutathione lyase